MDYHHFSGAMHFSSAAPSSSYGVSSSAHQPVYGHEHILSAIAKHAGSHTSQDGKGPSHSRGTLMDVTNSNQARSRNALSQGDRKPLASVQQASVGTRSQQSVGGAFKPVAQSSYAPSIPHGAFNDPRVIDGVTAEASVSKLERRRITREWIDVDAQNHDDPQSCSHYAQQIFEYLREAELLRRPDPNYLQVQPEINAKMRAILIDWLVEVSEEYKLCADTLYLAVGYLDRLLTVLRVPRAQLQLVGITCMWIAAKYEEIYPPNVSEFSYITDNTYSKEQLVAMEEEILKKLKYELTIPTAKTFLRRLLQVCNPDDQLHFMTNYLTEISLMDHDMMNFLPSEIAAAAVYLSNMLLSRVPWTATLEHYSFYQPHQLAECVEALASLHVQLHTRAQSRELTALYDKYDHQKYLYVARTSPLPLHVVSQHLALTSTDGGGVASRA